MSDKNQAKDKDKSKTAKPEAAAKKEETGSRIEKSRDSAPKREKVGWTLERCMKYARRYNSEQTWASGASASYKSAVAHGWKDQCVAEIARVQATGGKVIAGNFPKSGATSGKKAA